MTYRSLEDRVGTLAGCLRRSGVTARDRVAYLGPSCPELLEAVLTDSPDIDAAGVVARPDDKLGEVPVAFVVPAPGRALSPEKVLSLFDGRLASYKHPREVVILEARPRTAGGQA